MPPKRVMTAFVGLPVLALLIFFSDSFVFFLALLVTALVGQNEFYHLQESDGFRLQKFHGLLMGALLLSGFYTGNGAWVSGVLVLFVLLAMVFRTFSGREVGQAVREISVTCFGLFYVPYLFGYLLLLRGLEDGRAWIFFLFLTVWAGDTGAYYIGTRYGKRKLFPKVSPKKTLEGSAGGLFCSLMAGGLGKFFFFSPEGLVTMALLGTGLGLIGQVGDLAESILKRSSGLKDSGVLFPGHGGVLDRFDSILFAAPALYYLLQSGIG